MSDKTGWQKRIFSFSNLTGLQLYQLIRYGTFIAASIGFAKMQLPQSAIGEFETFLMVSSMLSFFWVSGIINTMLSIYPKADNAERSQIFFNAFLTLLFFGVAAGVLFFIFSNNLFSFLNKQNAGTFVKPVVIYLVANSPSFLIEYILYLSNRKKVIVVYALLSSVVTLCVVLIPVALGYNIVYTFYGLVAVALLKIVVTFFLIQQMGSLRVNVALQFTNLKVSLPLMLSILVSGSSEYIDGLIVKKKFDDVAFAVYRYGAKELPVLLIVANTFSTAMIAVVSADLTEGLEEIKRKSARLMHLFFPLSIALMLTSHFLFQYVFSESFIYSAFIFNIYLLLIVPRLLFPQTILMGMRQSGFLLASSVIEITVNVSLSLWMAAKFGLLGIAMATFVAFCSDKMFLMAVNYFKFGIAPQRYIPVLLHVVYSVLLFAGFAAGYWISVN
ncbi:MAG: oligosaccharide flippase family protein [Chitinophagales bacterium]|nr:oligosaccharide flippase family protein [Chitinophagales bacterium]